MNAFLHWLTSPIGLATWATLAATAIVIARLLGGPKIWTHFREGIREAFAFYRAIFTPWTWRRRLRAWCARCRP